MIGWLRRSFAASSSLIASVKAWRICCMFILSRADISRRSGGSSGAIGGDFGRLFNAS